MKGRVIICLGVFMNVFVYVKATSLRGRVVGAGQREY